MVFLHKDLVQDDRVIRRIRRMVAIASEPVRHSNCSTCNGKWNFQAMRCKAPKVVATTGRTNSNNGVESADESRA